MKRAPNEEGLSSNDPTPPRILAVADVAAVVEHRVYAPNAGHAEVVFACSEAIDAGVPILLCRPEHVFVAAEALAGTQVRVGSAVDFHTAGLAALSGPALAAAAEQLAEDGATELGLVAGVERLAERNRFERDVGALAGVAAQAGGRARVVINASGMAREELLAAAEASAAAGASLIHCGSWRGDRARFDLAVQVRTALDPGVLVKWTTPVRSLDVLLLGMAEGIDRFNANLDAILHQAEDRVQLGGIRIPRPGIDY